MTPHRVYLRQPRTMRLTLQPALTVEAIQHPAFAAGCYCNSNDILTRRIWPSAN